MGTAVALSETPVGAQETTGGCDDKVPAFKAQTPLHRPHFLAGDQRLITFKNKISEGLQVLPTPAPPAKRAAVPHCGEPARRQAASAEGNPPLKIQ